ncbi:uncharacterized protein [Nicotiana sylvestris]|uniref:uncharacterized protein n=1 Tax=Nicotiana sylvestris TaxID=4096 RepID=UPI00388C3815
MYQLSLQCSRSLVLEKRSLLCCRLLFSLKAFNKLKSELLRCETRLRKAVDGKKSLKLLCDEREDELAHLRYEASRSLNYESYLEEQCDRDEIKARVDTQVAAKKDALAKASALKVKLCNAHENISVRTDMILRIEYELLKIKVEVVDARAKAEAIRTKADKKVAVYLKDAADGRAELRGALDQESRGKEYVRCKSWRETLEKIHARGFDLLEEIKQAKANKYDAKFLLSDAEDSEKEADGP